MTADGREFDLRKNTVPDYTLHLYAVVSRQPDCDGTNKQDEAPQKLETIEVNEFFAQEQPLKVIQEGIVQAVGTPVGKLPLTGGQFFEITVGHLLLGVFGILLILVIRKKKKTVQNPKH